MVCRDTHTHTHTHTHTQYSVSNWWENITVSETLYDIWNYNTYTHTHTHTDTHRMITACLGAVMADHPFLCWQLSHISSPRPLCSWSTPFSSFSLHTLLPPVTSQESPSFLFHIKVFFSYILTLEVFPLLELQTHSDCSVGASSSTNDLRSWMTTETNNRPSFVFALYQLTARIKVN